MLTLGLIQRASLVPELLPDGAVVSLPAGQAVAVLDIRQVAGDRQRLLRLANIAVPQDTDVRVIARGDRSQYEASAAALVHQEALPWLVTAREAVSLELLNRGLVSKASFQVHFGLWVSDLTIADKIKLGVPLTPEEQRIDRALGIAEQVQRGLLPVPLDHLLLREHDVLDRFFTGDAVTIPGGPVPSTAFQWFTETGQVIILRRMWLSPGTAADNIQVEIHRDNESPYVVFPAFAAMTFDRPVECWIPALRELRVLLRSSATVVGYVFRLELLRVRLTNVLRARWGLAGPREVGQELWDQVRGGML